MKRIGYIDGRRVRFLDDYLLPFGTGEDVTIGWDGAALNILPLTNEVGAINFGDGAKQIDVKFFLGATNKYALFDVSASELVFENTDIHIGDGDNLRFGDAPTGDFVGQWGGNFMTFSMADTSKQLQWGANASGYDHMWYGDATQSNKSILWDASTAVLIFSGADIQLKDGDTLKLGDAPDFTFQWDGAKVSGWMADADNSAVYWGSGAAGYDVRWYGDSTQPSKYLLWDASLGILDFRGNAKPAVGGVVGVDYGPADATSFTVNRGIITAIS